ncbi:MAG: undecaprenyl/decaprenyl-phosphate alpha-N-acetylglucosaminyl 1-phosphate transferase [Coriobacteriia bacterium]|nr:undecaprenyl/decaprenyl-phosphate alpha-N-acetylglucosaminyl 1-phosphate transferase [Coriobacteriia bacterium]MCL2870286.1 undecaprenyl/decaprenyl-phosphate alpha-N-acetylglucosaminyl 1-phosphate transferase [Coriobacteriia bacterium]
MPIIRKIACRYDIVAHPGGRRIHKIPTPEIGGMGILFGIVVAGLAQFAFEHFLGWSGFLSDARLSALNISAIAGGTFVIYLTGLVDDIVDLSPGVKLAGQTAAATIVALWGISIDFLPNPFGGPNLGLDPVLSTILTVFYLVAFANITNLIDGMDGLAAGITAIAATSLMFLATDVNQLSAALIAAMLVGACLGFLPYNFNPASIFMGDQGALLLGFLLGIVSMMGVMKTTAAIALAVPLLIVAVPILDTLSAIIRRIRGKRSIQSADKGHLHHRLMRTGLSVRQTVLVVYLWSALLAVGAYAVRATPTTVRGLALVALLIVTALIAWMLGLFKVADHGQDNKVKSKKSKNAAKISPQDSEE